MDFTTRHTGLHRAWGAAAVRPDPASFDAGAGLARPPAGAAPLAALPADPRPLSSSPTGAHVSPFIPARSLGAPGRGLPSPEENTG